MTRVSLAPMTAPFAQKRQIGDGETRNQIVDLLRLACFTVVILGHVCSLGWGGAPIYLQRLATNGSFGVSLFFTVSGFLITRSLFVLALEPFPVRTFYLRRFSRIAPLLFFFVAIGLACQIWLPPEPFNQSFFANPKASFDGWFFASIITFTFNFLRLIRETESFGFGLHWDILWSLSVEEQFYLFYPIVFFGLRLRPALLGRLALLLIILAPVSRAVSSCLYPDSFLRSFTHTIACLDSLAFGCIAAVIAARWPMTPRRARQLVGISSAGIGFVYLLADATNKLDRVWAPSLFGLAAAALLVASSTDGVRLGRLWLWPARVGGLSYGCYLLHPIGIYLSSVFLYPSRPIDAFLQAIIITVALAASSAHFIEKPASRALVMLFGIHERRQNRQI